MDIVTQGILGASTAQAGAKQAEIRLATAIGFIAGMVPDLDTLIRSTDNPLLVLEYHRHFSHSLVFIPVAAFIVAGVFRLIIRRKIQFKILYLYALLGVCLAGLLDACTSYGTSLLWPFSDQKIAWNLIAIVDPVFTLLILVPLVIGLKKQSPRFARMGLTLILLYLVFAGVQSHRAGDIANELMTERGHTADRQIIKPTMGNIVLWKSLYLANGQFYADGIRPGLTGDNRVYTGTRVPQFIVETENPFTHDSVASTDLLRFAVLSDGWLAIHPARPDMVGDVRFSMLPTSTEPLWGVVLVSSGPENHLDLVTNRRFTEKMRNQFIDMLMARPINP